MRTIGRASVTTSTGMRLPGTRTLRRMRLHCLLGLLGLAVHAPAGAQTSDIRVIPPLYTPRDFAGPGDVIYYERGGMIARAISANGLVLAGEAIGSRALGGGVFVQEQQAFRWSATGGTQGLGFVPASANIRCFGPGISWCGFAVNLWGSAAHDRQMNS